MIQNAIPYLTQTCGTIINMSSIDFEIVNKTICLCEWKISIIEIYHQ
jgi:hypothetical protein